MHQRAGVKLYHGWMPHAPTGGLLLRDKQDEKRIASPANVPETSSVGSPDNTGWALFRHRMSTMISSCPGRGSLAPRCSAFAPCSRTRSRETP
jgi:hypothetical protein